MSTHQQVMATEQGESLVGMQGLGAGGRNEVERKLGKGTALQLDLSSLGVDLTLAVLFSGHLCPMCCSPSLPFGTMKNLGAVAETCWLFARVS